MTTAASGPPGGPEGVAVIPESTGVKPLEVGTVVVPVVIVLVTKTKDSVRVVVTVEVFVVVGTEDLEV